MLRTLILKICDTHFSQGNHIFRNLSSKTNTTKSSLAIAPAIDNSSEYEISPTREIDGKESKSLTFESKPNKALLARRPALKPILQMEEEELQGYLLSCKKPPLLERRGEFGGIYKAANIERKNQIDILATFQADLDFSIANLKRFNNTLNARLEIKNQA